MFDINQIIQNTKKFKAKYPNLRAFIEAYEKDLDSLANKADEYCQQLGITTFISGMPKAKEDLNKITDISTAKEYEEAFSKLYANYKNNFSKFKAINTFLASVKKNFNGESLESYTALQEMGCDIFFPKLIMSDLDNDQQSLEEYEQLAKNVKADIEKSIFKAAELTSQAEVYRTSLEAIVKDLTEETFDLENLSQKLKQRFELFHSALQSTHKGPSHFIEKPTDTTIIDLRRMLEPCDDKLGPAKETIYLQLTEKIIFIGSLAGLSKTYQQSLEKIFSELKQQPTVLSLIDGDTAQNHTDSSFIEDTKRLSRTKSIRFYNIVSQKDFLAGSTFITQNFFEEQLKIIGQMNIKSADILKVANDFECIDTANHPMLNKQKILVTKIKIRLHSFESLEEMINSWLRILQQIVTDNGLCADRDRLQQKINNANTIQLRVMSEMFCLIEKKRQAIAIFYHKIKKVEKALGAGTLQTSDSRTQLSFPRSPIPSPHSTLISNRFSSFPPRSTIASSTFIGSEMVSDQLRDDLLKLFKDYLTILDRRDASIFANWYDQCQVTGKRHHVSSFIAQLGHPTLTLTAVKEQLILLKDDNHQLRHNQVSLRRYYNEAWTFLRLGVFTQETVTIKEAALVDGELGEKILKAWELLNREETRLTKTQMSNQYK